MDKRKTVLIAVAVGAGITEDIGRCHNDFYLMQQRYNKNTDEQLATIQEEIGSVYEHLEELSKGKEDGR